MCFDTGSREMATEVRRMAAALGGISRIVLSHGHADHRGAARGIGAPVWCHEDERIDVEADAGQRYWRLGGPGLRRDLLRGQVMSALRDGGPVSVAGTVAEGDMVGQFVVIHLPGHAPGQIGLWRESDRTVLAGDCFHAIDDHTAGLPKSAEDRCDGARARLGRTWPGATRRRAENARTRGLQRRPRIAAASLDVQVPASQPFEPCVADAATTRILPDRSATGAEAG